MLRLKVEAMKNGTATDTINGVDITLKYKGLFWVLILVAGHRPDEEYFRRRFDIPDIAPPPNLDMVIIDSQHKHRRVFSWPVQFEPVMAVLPV